MDSIRTAHAPSRSGYQENAAHWNPISAVVAQAKAIFLQSIQRTKQVFVLLLNLSKRGLVDTAVVDGIHSADSSNGIFRRNRLGQFPVFDNALIELDQLLLNLFFELCNFFGAPMGHFPWFALKIRSDTRSSKQFKLLILRHEIFH